MKNNSNSGETSEKDSARYLLLGLLLYVCLTAAVIFAVRTMPPSICCIVIIFYIFVLNGLHIILFGKRKAGKCEEKGAAQDSAGIPEQEEMQIKE